jgi:hypothetical protein
VKYQILKKDMGLCGDRLAGIKVIQEIMKNGCIRSEL